MLIWDATHWQYSLVTLLPIDIATHSQIIHSYRATFCARSNALCIEIQVWGHPIRVLDASLQLSLKYRYGIVHTQSSRTPTPYERFEKLQWFSDALLFSVSFWIICQVHILLSRTVFKNALIRNTEPWSCNIFFFYWLHYLMLLWHDNKRTFIYSFALIFFREYIKLKYTDQIKINKHTHTRIE